MPNCVSLSFEYLWSFFEKFLPSSGDVWNIVEVPCSSTDISYLSARRTAPMAGVTRNTDNSVHVKYVVKHREVQMIFHARAIFVIYPHVAKTPSTNLFCLFLIFFKISFVSTSTDAPSLLFTIENCSRKMAALLPYACYIQ